MRMRDRSKSARGGDPFQDYAVTQAVIRFRQGIGRLIRSETDKGVLIIMDPRVSSSSYSEKFLKSLPTFSTDVYSLQELCEAIGAHFGS